MPFKPRKGNPGFDRLTSSLVNSGIATENNALYQTNQGLIDAGRRLQDGLTGKVNIGDSIAVTQVTGLINPQVGFYIPELINTVNITSSGAYVTYWTRFQRQIKLWGKVTIEPTANATFTELELTLPIPGRFEHEEQCSGVANGVPFATSTSGFPGIVTANPVTGNAIIRFYSTNAVDNDVRFEFTYLLIPK